MTPVSRVPQAVFDFLWLMGHRALEFQLVPFGTNASKALCDSYLAVHSAREGKLAVGLLLGRTK